MLQENVMAALLRQQPRAPENHAGRFADGQHPAVLHDFFRFCPIQLVAAAVFWRASRAQKITDQLVFLFPYPHVCKIGGRGEEA